MLLMLEAAAASVSDVANAHLVLNPQSSGSQ